MALAGAGGQGSGDEEVGMRSGGWEGGLARGKGHILGREYGKKQALTCPVPGACATAGLGAEQPGATPARAHTHIFPSSLPP